MATQRPLDSDEEAADNTALNIGDYIDGEPIDGEDLDEEEEDEPQHQGSQAQESKVRKKLPPQSHIKSYIAILTSALGGIDYSSEQEPPPYKLGEEAFLCLQDIEKWIRSHDKKENSSEVAVACAETGLVNDLVVILCMWNEGLDNPNTTISGFSKRHDEKIAKMCMKLLVLLTWPAELRAGMYQNQLENYHSVKKHQLLYKKHILTYKGGRVLQAIIKIVLPVIAKDKKDREVSDYSIIKQSVAFFRNLLKIEPPGIAKLSIKANKQSSLSENLPKGVTADDVGIGACIAAFHDNLVFTFFLTMCASIGTDREFDPEILALVFQDIIYFMLKSLKPSYIMQTPQTSTSTSSNSLGLGDLLSKEREMVNKFKKNSSSRHGRFGTLLSLQTPDMGRLTMSNTGNILGRNNIIASFDAHKKWNKTRKFVYEPDEEIVFPGTAIGASNREAFYNFVCDFLDGSFNPFIKACTKVLVHKKSEETITDEEKIHYFMTIAWFLEAQRERYGTKVEDVDYTLVGSAFVPEAFILLATSLVESTEDPKGKSATTSDGVRIGGAKYGLAHASMILYKEIVLVANTMSQSSLEENRDLAINLQKKIFTKDTYLTAVYKAARLAYKRSPEFVDSVVDTLDVTLKQLDLYADTDMKQFILYEKRKKLDKVYNEEQVIIDNTDEMNSKALERTAEKLQSVRKVLRDWFVHNLIHPHIISSYITFIQRYEDLPETSLKKAIKFLHRVFFQVKSEAMLYRLDFMLALHSMLADEGLHKSSKNRKHVESFMTHYMRRLKKALDKMPNLYIEVLFPMVRGKEIDHFLSTGELWVPQEKTKKATVVSQVVEFKHPEELDLDRKIALLVGALIDMELTDLVSWISGEMERIVTARLNEQKRPEEQENTDEPAPEPKDYAIKGSNNTFMLKLITEPRLRYILKLAGFTLPTTTDEDCVFYAQADLNKLIDVNGCVKIYLITPVTVDPPYESADDYLFTRHLREQYEKGAQEDDDIDVNNLAGAGYSSDEDDMAFNKNASDGENVGYLDDELDKLEAAIDKGESTQRGVAKKKGGSEKKQKKHRKKKKRGSRRGPGLHELSDDEDDSRPKKKQSHNYKSMEYILDSDDEDDAAFFEREEKLRTLLENNDGKLSTEQLRQMLMFGPGSSTIPPPVSVSETVSRDLSDDEEPNDTVHSLKRKASGDESPSSKRRKEVASGDESESGLGSDSESDSGSSGSESEGDSDDEPVLEKEESITEKEDTPMEDVAKDDPTLVVSGQEDEETRVRASKKRVIIADSDDE